MKRFLIVAIFLIGLISLVIIGCNKEMGTPTGVVLEDGTIVSSCVACHTDKEMLQAVAEEEVEVTSEETSGEG